MKRGAKHKARFLLFMAFLASVLYLELRNYAFLTFLHYDMCKDFEINGVFQKAEPVLCHGVSINRHGGTHETVQTLAFSLLKILEEYGHRISTETWR